jgi:hypothetical protein
MQVDLRVAILGSDRVRSLEGVATAAGLYAIILLGSFVAEVPSVPGLGAILEPGGVLAGVALAGWWAYRNSGFVVSIVLVLGPVLGRLTYYAWRFAYGSRGAPVALIGSFGGTGSWKFWVPLAVLLGAIAFGVGVAARWGRRLVDGQSRSTTG